MTKAKLKTALTVMTDPYNGARYVASQLGISLSTLYAYIDAQWELMLIQPSCRVNASALLKQPSSRSEGAGRLPYERSGGT